MSETKQNIDEVTLEVMKREFKDILEDFESTDIFKIEPRLPVHLFEANFYDYFTGKVKDKDESIKILKLWKQIAGHLSIPVVIFDIATGKDLFVIPSLMNTDLIDYSKSKALSYALKQYKSHYVRSPKVANAYLNNNSDKIFENLRVDNYEEKKREAWLSFINYYELDGKSVNTSIDGDDLSEEIDFGF